MKVLQRFILASTVLAAVVFASCRSTWVLKEIAVANLPRAWLVPCDSTFASISDCFDERLGLFPYPIESSFRGQTIKRLEYEIRDASRPLRLARIPFQDRAFLPKGADELSDHPQFNHPYFSESNRHRLLVGIGPGRYLIALLADGVRISNVVSVHIDPTYDYKSQPAVRIGKIEAPPLCFHGILVAWVLGPPAGSPRISYSDVVGGAIFCDGVLSSSPYRVFAANPTFRSGEIRAERLEVERYDPPPPVSGIHTYVLKAGAYTSAPFPCDLSTTPLADVWENEADTVTDAPAPPHVLSGFVGDRHGRAFTQAEVLVYNEHESYIELVDRTGRYSFVNVPPGKYSADCYRLDVPNGPTHAYFAPIVIASGASDTRDFIFPDNPNR